ncbi:chromatin assembly factor 1, p105 subunit [Anticarsia gemmatalis]|uniref:chromatin assembly factor 1, p105 subunit n=1 Tax=Anticarsia gemmatalis TaxID=129554 RepID=UPI003F762786
MKFAIPEISWHNRDPVLSVDFQPKAEASEPLRLATGGTDSHVLIWYISTTDTGSVNLEVAADLTRHQKAVNVVRWSPNGQYLASGDDESIIFIWKKTDKEPVPSLEQSEEQYKESWVIHKTLRGHMEDVLDISWSANSLHLASGSVDNKLLIWDVSRGKYSSILTDHKGFVQGVSWDPKGQLIASASTDRVFRTFDVTSKKVTSRSSKAILPFPAEHPLHDIKVRLYHDDTLQTYYRRLQFSPDGVLLAVPAGKIEPEQGKVDLKPMNAVYIYTRYSLKVPACILPCGEPALVTRWSPRRYAVRADGPSPAIPTARRMLLAVGTKRSVLIYDTQQKTPIALISNIHYTRLTDLTWSPDGRTLVASSTDGYCSVITFGEGELGEVLPDDVPEPTPPAAEPMEVEETPDTKEDKKPEEAKPEQKEPKTPTAKETQKNKIDSFIKFKAPGEKSPKKQKIEVQQKTPVKIDVLEEVAMPSWSDNSSSEIIKPKETKDSEVMIIDDSEDIKLVYDETQGAKSSSQSPDSPKANTTKDSPKTTDKPTIQLGTPKSNQNPSKSQPGTPKSTQSTLESSNFLKQAKVTDVKEAVAVKSAPSPKAPRRVSFVTLSSPKNAKKK